MGLIINLKVRFSHYVDLLITGMLSLLWATLGTHSIVFHKNV